MKKQKKAAAGTSKDSMPRRTFLKSATTLAAGASLSIPGSARSEDSALYKVIKGRIQQSVVHWCFNPMSVEELARNAASLGMKSVELMGAEHFGTLKKHGLICAISGSHGFSKGFAHKEEHEECLIKLRESIDATAAAGFPSVITFSGFRRGLPTEVGMDNMVEGLKKVVGYAEKKKVTLCLEMLNSRVNVTMKGHPDYFCDDIDRSVEVCKRVGSERLKVLFDIYHVQIMHGDVITRIKQHHPFIGHYHTAGVPGRNEIDDTQEINYPPIMKAIVETGYKGYVAQEFIPLRDKVESLSQSVKICDV
ncbi:MAG: Hydroxypyruvate isomerase [Verrucomicrobiales bacterium]|nr:Hydroxypyruvate isomerase [Verrucomicrobiales bacterium]